MVKRFTETVDIRQQDLRTGGVQAALSLADRLEGFKQLSLQVASQQAAERGLTSGTEEPLVTTEVDGRKVTQAPKLREKRFIGNIEINAHNKALRSAYLASLNNDNRENIANIQSGNPDNVIGFNEAVEGYRKGVLSSVEPGVRGLVAQDLDNKITSARIRVQQADIAKQRQEANAERKANIESAADAAAAQAREGDVAASAESIVDAFTTIESMVESGDLPADRAQIMKREIEREASEQGIRKTLTDTADNEGLDQAYDQLDEIAKKVPKGWTPDEWDSFTASAQADLNRKAARDRDQVKQNTKEQKQLASVERGKLFMDPGIPADPAKSSQDRKDVNAAYDDVSKSWSVLPIQEQINNNVAFIKNTGIVPDSVISNVNAAARSGTPEQVELMTDLIGRIEELPNAAAALRDLPDESRAFSKQVADSRRAGMETEQAIEIARKNTFGQTAQQREAIKIQTQAVAKDLPDFLADSVDKAFDPSAIPFFGEEPDIPVNMQADYNVAFKQFMTLTDGNTEQAKVLAFDSLKKVWAITEVGGQDKFMKSAPEAFYSVDGFDNSWISKQFNADMEEVNAIGAELSTDFNTGRSNTPSYPVIVTNDQGFADVLRDPATGRAMRWQPDFRKTEEFIEISESPGKAIESAKKRRQRKLENRAGALRRDVQQRVFRGVARADRENFSASPEGKVRTEAAINNLLALERIDEVEAGQLLKAFGVND